MAAVATVDIVKGPKALGLQRSMSKGLVPRLRRMGSGGLVEAVKPDRDMERLKLRLTNILQKCDKELEIESETARLARHRVEGCMQMGIAPLSPRHLRRCSATDMRTSFERDDDMMDTPRQSRRRTCFGVWNVKFAPPTTEVMEGETHQRLGQLRGSRRWTREERGMGKNSTETHVEDTPHQDASDEEESEDFGTSQGTPRISQAGMLARRQYLLSRQQQHRHHDRHRSTHRQRRKKRPARKPLGQMTWQELGRFFCDNVEWWTGPWTWDHRKCWRLLPWKVAFFQGVAIGAALTRMFNAGLVLGFFILASVVGMELCLVYSGREVASRQLRQLLFPLCLTMLRDFSFASSLQSSRQSPTAADGCRARLVARHPTGFLSAVNVKLVEEHRKRDRSDMEMNSTRPWTAAVNRWTAVLRFLLRRRKIGLLFALGFAMGCLISRWQSMRPKLLMFDEFFLM